MDWIERMNRTLQYIESHLDDEIDYGEIARLASCSFYHFQKVFSYMANVTLGEYIRRRRLTLAAFDLQGSGQKVIEIALKYGYESPTSFTRAFRQFHQMAPSEAKAPGKLFTSYPPISFQITVRGVTAMNYRIVHKEAFRVVGAKISTTMKEEQCFQEIPRFWSESKENGLLPKLCDRMEQELKGILGISVSRETAAQLMEFDYYIAAATNQEAFPGTETFIVPASTWAIFECVGAMPDSIQQLQQRIMMEWLPASGYDFNHAPDIEVYTEGDTTNENYKSYVWLPVKKKE